MISEFCEGKCESLVEKLNGKLQNVNEKFENVRKRLSPNKSYNSMMELSGYSPS